MHEHEPLAIGEWTRRDVEAAVERDPLDLARQAVRAVDLRRATAVGGEDPRPDACQPRRATGRGSGNGLPKSAGSPASLGASLPALSVARLSASCRFADDVSVTLLASPVRRSSWGPWERSHRFGPRPSTIWPSAANCGRSATVGVRQGAAFCADPGFWQRTRLPVESPLHRSGFRAREMKRDWPQISSRSWSTGVIRRHDDSLHRYRGQHSPLGGRA
jgi:hypothetical protein